MDADSIIGLLADDTRLRVAAAAILEPTTTERLARIAGVPARRAVEALTKLESGGLIRRTEDGIWQFWPEVLAEVARAARPVEEHGEETPAETVLRAFVSNGRLTQIPAVRSKRLVVLDRLAAEFEPGQRYDERQVNDALRVWHDDVAALRRYLVDEGFLSRDHGAYWRTGGSIDLAN
ncbi:MAG: DUF2087 domain-containing protein [Frankiaceae bacterium]|nr:DUF2087 domain-containing protein [Frankiaceae bacterium]